MASAAGAAAPAAAGGETMNALLLTKTGHATDGLEVGTTAKPVAGKGQVLVKIKAASVNPVDWKRAAYAFLVPTTPVVLGWDSAGTVAAIGEGVTNVKVGDEVFAWQPAVLVEGCWAEYCRFPANHVLPAPEGWKTNEVPALGVVGLTATQALFHKIGLGLNLPSDKITDEQFVLVWGAAGAVGQMATQLATLAGYKVIGVCSPRSDDLVMSMGAVATVDYHDDDCSSKIATIAGGNLTLVFDTASDGKGAAAAMSTDKPGQLRTIAGSLKPEDTPANITHAHLFVGTPTGSPPQTDEVVDALFKIYTDEVWPLIKSGALKPLGVKSCASFEELAVGVKTVVDHKTGGCKVVLELS